MGGPSQSCFHDKVLRKLYGQSYDINKPLGKANNYVVLYMGDGFFQNKSQEAFLV